MNLCRIKKMTYLCRILKEVGHTELSGSEHLCHVSYMQSMNALTYTKQTLVRKEIRFSDFLFPNSTCTSHFMSV